MGYRESLDFCWEILPKVSRSFAIPIRLLPRPTGDAVMLGYLIFRIADTIEDCCPDRAERERDFRAFRRLLEGNPTSKIATIGPSPYDELMRRADAVADVFQRLPTEVRSLVFARLDEMAGGMQSWSERAVRTLPDLHDYCYYVAGVVGKLLTRIFRSYGHIGARQFEELDRMAVEFGIALQMVNVIRDVRADHEEGRHYWPLDLLERHGLTQAALFEATRREVALRVLQELVRDALVHCDVAVRYLTRLPPHQVRVRAFCALPLYMAVATLRECSGNPAVLAGPRPVKIARTETRRILALSLFLAPFNSLLRLWYSRLRAMI